MGLHILYSFSTGHFFSFTDFFMVLFFFSFRLACKYHLMERPPWPQSTAAPLSFFKPLVHFTVLFDTHLFSVWLPPTRMSAPWLGSTLINHRKALLGAGFIWKAARPSAKLLCRPLKFLMIMIMKMATKTCNFIKIHIKWNELSFLLNYINMQKSIVLYT